MMGRLEVGSMMGRLERDQEQLFYEYRLDDLVPADHLARQVDAVLDLSWPRAARGMSRSMLKS